MQYRCVNGAGTDSQCFKVATKKVEGKWLCDKHGTIPQPEVTVPNTKPWPRPNKNNPEEWKAYNRQYRREYRRVNGRKSNGFTWTVELVIWVYYSKSSLWRLTERSEYFGESIFHCEDCCEQIKVNRTNSLNPKTWWRKPFTGSTYYRGKHYKVSAPHQCQHYPSSPIQYKHCNRCGVLGTKKTIRHNRQPSGWYGDDLCLSCWRIMRPYYQKEREEFELNEALAELRRAMRKADIAVSVRAPSRYWKYDSLPDYHETWYIQTKRELNNGMERT